MKKFLSLVLALVMALSLTTVAWGAPTAANCANGATCTDHEAAIGADHYDTLANAVADAVAAGSGTVTLLKDVTVASAVQLTAGITLDGAGHKITSTDVRGINVPGAPGATVIIKNLTLVTTNPSAERGISFYNTDLTNVATLELDNVTVSGTATYAFMATGDADGSTVEIKNSNLSSMMTLNIWGSNMTINVTNSTLNSVETDPDYTYSAIQLNYETTGNKNNAEGTVVNVIGGKIDGAGDPVVAVTNWTSTGKVNFSGTTEVNGSTMQIVAMIGKAGFTSVEDANTYAEEKGSTEITVLPAASAQGSFTPLAGVTYKDPAGATITPAADGTITPPSAGFVAGKYDLYDANGALVADDVFAEAVDAAYNVKTATGNVEYYELTVNGVTQKYYVECAKPDADVYLALSGSTSAIVYLEKVPFVNYTAAKAYYNIGTACGQLPGNDAKYDYFTYSDADGVPYYFVETATGATEALMVNGELVFVKTAGTTVPHTWEVLTVNAKHEVTELICDDCDAVATVYATKLAAPKGAVKYAPYGWIAINAPVASTPSTDKVTSAETFDAGIAMYVGMSVMAAAGSAVVIGKKRED